ncbi:hypothetical protein [Lacrimispora amygdalina]|uniref:hypothetical protein n=1 Tax=Lacrimispora amygdalina TaxID=253257 RepID=UPI000BE357A4|nr:hypothetical protein [Lacrimispora amygdalina]
MELKTDYMDAMFDGQRRYRLIPNEDGTYSLPDETTYTQKGDKFGANDINQTNEEINKLEAVKIVTLPIAGWSNSAPYTQTVEVLGIAENDRPIVSLYLPDDITAADVKLQSKSYGCMDRALTGAENITVYCYSKKPAVDFQIQIKGV